MALTCPLTREPTEGTAAGAFFGYPRAFSSTLSCVGTLSLSLGNDRPQPSLHWRSQHSDLRSSVSCCTDQVLCWYATCWPHSQGTALMASATRSVLVKISQRSGTLHLTLLSLPPSLPPFSTLPPPLPYFALLSSALPTTPLVSLLGIVRCLTGPGHPLLQLQRLLPRCQGSS